MSKHLNHKIIIYQQSIFVYRYGMYINFSANVLSLKIPDKNSSIILKGLFYNLPIWNIQDVSSPFNILHEVYKHSSPLIFPGARLLFRLFGCFLCYLNESIAYKLLSFMRNELIQYFSEQVVRTFRVFLSGVQTQEINTPLYYFQFIQVIIGWFQCLAVFVGKHRTFAYS